MIATSRPSVGGWCSARGPSRSSCTPVTPSRTETRNWSSTPSWTWWRQRGGDRTTTPCPGGLGGAGIEIEQRKPARAGQPHAAAFDAYGVRVREWSVLVQPGRAPPSTRRWSFGLGWQVQLCHDAGDVGLHRLRGERPGRGRWRVGAALGHSANTWRSRSVAWPARSRRSRRPRRAQTMPESSGVPLRHTVDSVDLHGDIERAVLYRSPEARGVRVGRDPGRSGFRAPARAGGARCSEAAPWW